ncbi:MAG TPA: DUF5615 family PIN-like protein [Thermoanaerobaculia bacterium]
MKLLVDNCVAPAVTAALRGEGHDVVAVKDWPRDPGDEEILAFAEREQRVVITLDHDYGALIFRDRKSHAGLVRLAPMHPEAQVAVSLRVVREAAEDLAAGAVVVATRKSIRRRLP